VNSGNSGKPIRSRDSGSRRVIYQLLNLIAKPCIH